MELEDLEGGQDFPFCNPFPTQRDPPAATDNYPHLLFSTCFPLLPITGAITFRSVPQLCLLRLSLSREIPTIIIDYSRRPTV